MRLVFFLCLVAAALASASDAQNPIQLRDVTRETGITFVHTDGSSGQRYIVETVASGLAVFDYDNDGDADIYFLSGAKLGKSADVGKAASPPRNALWRNDGNWKFTDVTERSGLGDTSYSVGVATADYDNDGDQDVYISNFGPNKLYRNNGDGTFADVTKKAGVEDGDKKIGAGVAFLDIDHDGDLDLFAAHYVDFSYENHRGVRFSGHPAYAGPLDYRPTPFSLFRNNGDGTFADASADSGVGNYKGAGMGVICFDAELDGDTDIFVANDKTGNSLLLNDGKGNFKENAGLAGLAYDMAGRAQGSMGIECGDVDNDGLLDLFVTTYQQELATLFRNAGKGMFDDVTAQTRAGEGTLRYVKWGVGVVDFDHDGLRDLFVACGHLHDNVHLFDNTTLYEAPSIVLRNMGRDAAPPPSANPRQHANADGAPTDRDRRSSLPPAAIRFVNVSAKSGDGPLIKRSARGAAFDDLDNDGDIDVVILNSRKGPTIMRNESVRGNWLQVRLAGTRGNRDGIGARVKLVSGDLTLVDEVHSGRGYQSDYGRRLHFGLGKREKIDRVEVRWPGGRTNVVAAPALNKLLIVTEGE